MRHLHSHDQWLGGVTDFTGISAADSAAGDWFGFAVDLDGDTIINGAAGEQAVLAYFYKHGARETACVPDRAACMPRRRDVPQRTEPSTPSREPQSTRCGCDPAGLRSGRCRRTVGKRPERCYLHQQHHNAAEACVDNALDAAITILGVPLAARGRMLPGVNRAAARGVLYAPCGGDTLVPSSQR